MKTEHLKQKTGYAVELSLAAYVLCSLLKYKIIILRNPKTENILTAAGKLTTT